MAPPDGGRQRKRDVSEPSLYDADDDRRLFQTTLHAALDAPQTQPFLFGVSYWTLLKEDSRRLQAFHMTCQRRILGVRWNDFVTNRAVADSTNLPSILSTIAARRHSFFGHIRRLSANTPAHKALKLAVDSRSGDIPHHDWNRPAGRPRTTWMSQIVRDTGLTAAADAWALADDRSTWRALRPTAGYTQQ